MSRTKKRTADAVSRYKLDVEHTSARDRVRVFYRDHGGAGAERIKRELQAQGWKFEALWSDGIPEDPRGRVLLTAGFSMVRPAGSTGG
jgi:hypothetical protein